MLFNSSAFLLFLPLVLLAYHLAPARVRKPLLLVASYVFYAAWDWRFLGLLVLSTAVDYACARAMRSAAPVRRKHLLYVSLALNLGVLATFKYFDFFVANLRALLHTAGLGVLDSVGLELILPLGISFYTFQTLAYTIDVYRGDIEACDRPVDYAIFVAYFPQLVAGPIERASRLLPQIAQYRPPDGAMIRAGFTLILFGFAKKVVLGDALLSPYVEGAFANPAAQSGPELVLGALLFSLQIYTDFSGYSDIARGTSRLLGIELMVNFDQPYLASNITAFWRRWHISLSTWLRDYLYIPLGGNRGGRAQLYRNLMLTMGLGGLWHGASWNFVIWGLLHGVLLAGHRAWRGPRRNAEAGGGIGAIAGCVGTNLCVVLAWVFFRASDLPTALAYLAGLASAFTSAGALALSALAVALYAGVVLLLDLPPRRAGRHEFSEDWPEWARILLYTALITATWTAWPASSVPFIYFQF